MIGELETLYGKEFFDLNDQSLALIEQACQNDLQNLLRLESRQIQDNNCTVTFASIKNLGRLAVKQPLNLDTYNRVKKVFCILIENLSLDSINKPIKILLCKQNIFSLVVEHLTQLYRLFLEQFHYHCVDLQKAWFVDVCVPLMKKDIIVNAGHSMFGQTDLHLCLRYCIPREGKIDPLFELIQFILTKRINLNTADTSGMTALYIALMRQLPESILKQLIALGGDVNAKCASGPFSNGGYVRIPLLSHCVKRKFYRKRQYILIL